MSIANELITRGWKQDSSEDWIDGSVCLGKAACHAVGLRYGWNHPEVLPAWEAIVRVLGIPTYGSPGGAIAIWNDDPERTYDEVLRVAKEADEILDAK